MDFWLVTSIGICLRPQCSEQSQRATLVNSSTVFPSDSRTPAREPVFIQRQIAILNPKLFLRSSSPSPPAQQNRVGHYNVKARLGSSRPPQFPGHSIHTVCSLASSSGEWVPAGTLPRGCRSCCLCGSPHWHFLSYLTYSYFYLIEFYFLFFFSDHEMATLSSEHS